eukprot:6105995-Amphidinium_carterae.1
MAAAPRLVYRWGELERLVHSFATCLALEKPACLRLSIPECNFWVGVGSSTIGSRRLVLRRRASPNRVPLGGLLCNPSLYLGWLPPVTSIAVMPFEHRPCDAQPCRLRAASPSSPDVAPCGRTSGTA